MRLLKFSLNNYKKRFNTFQCFFPELVTITADLYLVWIFYANYLRQCCTLFILNIAINKDFLEITVPKKSLLQLLKFIHSHSLIKSQMLMDYTVIDFPGKFLRFEVNLFLLSLFWNSRLKIRLFTNELSAIPTVTHIYKVGFWQEREIWDLFGVVFQNHTDLRRLLTDYGFLGHPLRKDFPLTGYIELFFDDFKRNIITAPVSLAQEYRFYFFQNPWINV